MSAQTEAEHGTIQLDTCFEGDGDLQTLLDRLKETYGVDARVVVENGPAGGWPVVEYSGPVNALQSMERMEWGDDEGNPEWVEVRPGKYPNIEVNHARDQYRVELDVYVEAGDERARSDEIAAYAERYGVEHEVIHLFGPGGGYPSVRFQGTPNAIRILASEHEQDRSLLTIGVLGA